MISCLALALAAFLFLSWTRPHGDWDAWKTWNLKARFLHCGTPLWKSMFRPELETSLPDYPLLLPGAVARLWSALGEESTAVPIAIAGFFAFGAVALLAAAATLLRGWRTGLFAGLALAGTSTFVKQGAWQMADVPLAFFFLAAVALTAIALEDGRAEPGGTPALPLALAGLCAGAECLAVFPVLLRMLLNGFRMVIGLHDFAGCSLDF